MNIAIRDEKSGDAQRIYNVTESAFKSAEHTSHTEQFIVNALRESNALTVSLVAVADGEIVGHVALSPVRISDGAANWYGIGPLSVLPEHQRKSIGSKLMRGALEAIECRGAAGCVVLGDPGYYGRFGFRPVAGLVFPGVPPEYSEYFQALSFGGEFAQGEVRFHPAFSVQA